MKNLDITKNLIGEGMLVQIPKRLVKKSPDIWKCHQNVITLVVTATSFF